MRKLLFVSILLLLIATGFMIRSRATTAPSTCTCSTQIFSTQGNPLPGVRFFVKVHSSVVGGVLIQPADFNTTTDAAGVARIRIVQGAKVTISSEHPAFATPVTRTWPSATTCSLVTLFGVPVPAAVFGPGSSTDNALVRWDDVTGAAIQNSVGTLSDTGALAGITSFVTGISGQRLTLNPTSTDVTGTANSGGAPLLFENTFSFTDSTHFHSVGYAIRSSFGSTTGASAVFWTPYWFLTGSNGTPVPAGTKGNLSGYEANIFTSQAAADMSEAVHAFGATIVGHGGAGIYGAAVSITVDTVASNIRVFNTDIAKNVAGGTQNAFYASSSGSQAASAVLAGSGSWGYAVDCTGFTLSGGGLRAKNNSPAVVARNSLDNGDVTLLSLNTTNQIVIGAPIVNNVADPYYQVGDNSTGWLFQKIDSDSRLRLFKQGTGELLTISATGMVLHAPVGFASLGAPTNGTLVYCSDCANASNPCVGAGSGAFAKRLAGSWDCR